MLRERKNSRVLAPAKLSAFANELKKTWLYPAIPLLQRGAARFLVSGS